MMSTTSSSSEEVYTANIKPDSVDTNQQSTPVPFLVGGEGWFAINWIVSKIYNPVTTKKSSGGKGGKSGGSQTTYRGDAAGRIGRGMFDEWLELEINGDTVWKGSIGRDAGGGTGEYGWLTLDECKARLHWGTETGTGDFLMLNSGGEEHPYYRGWGILELKDLLFGSSNTPPTVRVKMRKSAVVSGIDSGHTREGINPVAGIVLATRDNLCGLGRDIIEPTSAATLANTLKARTQTVTVAGASVTARMAYQSILLSERMSFRSFFAGVAENYDGWARAAGDKIELGAFPHDGGDTSGLLELTLHDFAEDPQLDNPGPDADDIITAAVVTGPDRDWYWDDTPQRHDNAATLTRLDGEVRLKSFTRKNLITAYQRKQQAVDLTHYYARPGGNATVSVRREKAKALWPGNRFVLNYGPSASRRVFRVLRRTDPSTGGVIKFSIEVDRGTAPLSYVGTPDPAPALPEPPTPVVIAAARVLQVPGTWAGSTAPTLLVLVSRPSPNTLGYDVHYSRDDASYDKLARLRNFAIHGATLSSLSTGATSFNVALTSYDMAMLESQSSAMKKDDTLLLIIDNEVMSIGAVTALGSGQYTVDVLRGRRGSGVATHASGAEVWVIPREDCELIANADFPREETAAWLKLPGFTPRKTQDLADALKLPFTFATKGVSTAGDFSAVALIESIALSYTVPAEEAITYLEVHEVAAGGGTPAANAVPSFTVPVTPGTAMRTPCGKVAAGVQKDYYGRFVDSGAYKSAFMGPASAVALAVPITYWLTGVNSIKITDTLSLTSLSSTGSGAPVAYAGRYVIAEHDGSNYVTRYTSAANESAKTWTPTAGTLIVRVRLYLAGGTSTLLDEQFATIVANGTNGTSAVTIYIRSAVQPSTPTGDNPSGWTAARPTSGTGAIWASSGTKTSAGVLVGSWSTPVRESGSVTFTQSTDPAAGGANAVLPTDIWFDTSNPQSIQIKVRNAANNGWTNNTLATLAVSQLLSGTMTGINIDIVGGGRILFNNGTVWNVIGTGFGPSNQFVEWFGPVQSSLSQCTEAKAISYKKTDGSAYFGGALSAGTLSNSIQTSDLSSTAQVTLGPFGTNGSSKLVTVSYAFDSYGATTSDNSGDASAVVQLYRKIGTGSETLVATLTATGSTWANYEAEQVPHWVWSCHIGGSLTYTDNNASTADRTYRAVISSRSGATLGGTSTSQRVGIISVEQ